MLGKLFNAEWKATSRWLIPLHLILLVVTAMGKLLLTTGLMENEAFFILSILAMTFYVLLIMATSFVTMIFLVIRFYKSLFSNEGYLTFTLPVTANQLLISKIGVSLLWYIIDSITLILSIFVLVINEKTWNSFIDYLPTFHNGLEEVIGFSGIGGILFLILYIVVYILSIILMFDVSICIGQLMSKHKVLGAILSYIGIYMLLQTIAYIAMFAFGALTMDAKSTSIILNTYHILVPCSLIFFIVLCSIYYFISKYIMKNKLNLD